IHLQFFVQSLSVLTASEALPIIPPFVPLTWSITFRPDLGDRGIHEEASPSRGLFCLVSYCRNGPLWNSPLSENPLPQRYFLDSLFTVSTMKLNTSGPRSPALLAASLFFENVREWLTDR